MTLAAALARGELDDVERILVRSAWRNAADRAKQNGYSLPTALDVRVALRQMNEHIATSSVRTLVAMAGELLADGDAG